MSESPDTAVLRRAALADAIERVSRGDRAAMRSVYEQTSAKLFGVIVLIVPDRELAQDTLQEVYLKVWKRAGRFDPARASPITWLCTIARNSAIDQWRRSGQHPAGDPATLDVVADDRDLSDTALCKLEEREALRRCMDGLADDHRRSIRLAYFHGLSHSELAERLKVPLGTLKSWIRRGLRGLKVCLDV